MTRRPDDERHVTEVEAEERPSRSQRVVIPLTLDRRTFVRQGGAAVTSTALGGAALSAGHDVAVAQDGESMPPDVPQPVEVMNRPEDAPEPGRFQSLSEHEAETVDALTSRIMPGDPNDPGAHEAGVVVYIDSLLAFQEGFAEYTYLHGPWAQTQTSLEMLAAGERAPVASSASSPQATPASNRSGEGRTVEVGAGEFYYDPSEIQVSPGDTLRMTNEGSAQHDMAVEDWDDQVIIPRLDPGETAEYTIPEDAETGSTLTIYCTVTGHREAGMEGALRIVAQGTRAASPVASPGATPMASSQASPQATPQATPAAFPAALAEEAGLDYEFVLIPEEDIERYGYQSVLTPRDVYRIGIEALDRYTQQQYGGKSFRELNSRQQDEVIGDMANGNISNFDPALTARSFFHNLRRHTSEGMFSDPAYGGNRDMVGWRLIGFPGAQRAYLPEDIQTEGTYREPQSMDELHPFNPGRDRGDHENVILPVSGSDEGESDHQDQDSNP